VLWLKLEWRLRARFEQEEKLQGWNQRKFSQLTIYSLENRKSALGKADSLADARFLTAPNDLPALVDAGAALLAASLKKAAPRKRKTPPTGSKKALEQDAKESRIKAGKKTAGAAKKAKASWGTAEPSSASSSSATANAAIAVAAPTASTAPAPADSASSSSDTATADSAAASPTASTTSTPAVSTSSYFGGFFKTRGAS